MMAGLLSAAAGVFMIWMCYCFATMMDPDVQGDARQSTVWRQVTGDSLLPISILLIGAGIWLAFGKLKRSN
jgi:hypothetical protein